MRSRIASELLLAVRPLPEAAMAIEVRPTTTVVSPERSF
jgi:hypothetical protein